MRTVQYVWLAEDPFSEVLIISNWYILHKRCHDDEKWIGHAWLQPVFAEASSTSIECINIERSA